MDGQPENCGVICELSVNLRERDGAHWVILLRFSEMCFRFVLIFAL